jgi:S1-C subfamily serine protease
MIRTTLSLIMALSLMAQSPRPAKPPTEDEIIQRFRTHAKPRPVAPAAPLSAEERNVIRRFKDAKPSVVYISAFLPNLDPEGPPKIAMGSGTGFVWDEFGHIVTNRHVISAEQDGKIISDVTLVEITLANGKAYKGRVIGLSFAYDIAVVQAFAPLEAMRPIPLGQRANLQVGQGVLAIGNPFEQHHSLTKGIISALGREIPTGYGTRTANSIQTDAAINPGNSGGPLLDMGGRLIGMNTAIAATSSEGSVGVGFAIPVDTLNNIVPRLIARGEIETPRMGFTTLTPFEADKAFGIKRGLVVLEVDAESPAARAGLRPLKADKDGRLIAMGDILLTYQGQSLTSGGQFKALLEYLAMVEKSFADEATFEVLRDGKVLTVVLDLRTPKAGEKGKPHPASI